MKKLIAICVSGAFALALTGCNTIQGAGKDIERGGEKIQDASIKARSDWRAARDRNDRDYETARGSCSAGTDAQRDACRDKARAAYSARMEEARRTNHRAEMRSESDEDRREEAYEMARDKCNAMRGTDEDRCVADARARYHH